MMTTHSGDQCRGAEKEEKGCLDIYWRKYAIMCCCHRTGLAMRHRSTTNLFAFGSLVHYSHRYILSFLRCVASSGGRSLHSHCTIASNVDARSLEPRYNGWPESFSVVFTTTEFARCIFSVVSPDSLPRFNRLPVFDLDMFMQ